MLVDNYYKLFFKFVFRFTFLLALIIDKQLNFLSIQFCANCNLNLYSFFRIQAQIFDILLLFVFLFAIAFYFVFAIIIIEYNNLNLFMFFLKIKQLIVFNKNNIILSVIIFNIVNATNNKLLSLFYVQIALLILIQNI